HRADGVPVDEDTGDVVAGVRSDRERVIGAAVDRDRRADRAVRAGRRGQDMGVDREAGRDRVIFGDVGEGVAGDRADRVTVDQDVRDVVAGIRRDRELVTGTAVDRDRRADRAVRAGRGAEDVGVDREARRDRVVFGDVGEGVAGDSTDRVTVDQDVRDVVAGI